MYGFATLDSNTLLLSIFDEWADLGKSKIQIVNSFYLTKFNQIKRLLVSFVSQIILFLFRILRKGNRVQESRSKGNDSSRWLE